MDQNTTQQLWRTSYKYQFTKQMLLDLIKRVEALIKRYERYMPRKSTDTAEDRIHTAIAKLFAGTRTWDPSRVDLPGFLAGVVASDLSSEVERSTKATFVSIDDERPTDDDDYTGESLDDVDSNADAWSQAGFEPGWSVTNVAPSIEGAWSLVMTQLRSRAGTDADLLALLAVFEERVYEKRAVMALLNWTARKYKAVFARLMALAATLDESVRNAIADALTD